MEVVLEYAILFASLLCVLSAIFVFIAATIKKSKKLAIAGFILVVVSMVIIVRGHYSEFWRIDSCLDSGGRFNYEQQKCEH